jgi:hypothetical protein
VSKNLSPDKLNYTVTEKEFLAVVHAINKFHHYITGYKLFVHTNHSTIIFLRNKPITNGRVTRWLLLLHEFNITVLDRQGKENLVDNFISHIKNEDDDILVDDSFPDEHLFSLFVNTLWFVDMENYLATRKLPSHLSPNEKCRIITQSANYSWVGHDLFCTGPDFIIRRCVREDEIPKILRSCHGPCGGHFSDKHTTYKVLHSCYYWPSIFKDVAKYVRSCNSFQRTGRPTLVDEIPLHAQVMIEPFEKWALDFVGPISPISRKKNDMLVCTDYVTKWVKAKSLFMATEKSIVEFIYEDIFTCFGVPHEIVTDQGTQFTSKLMKELTEKYGIKHYKSSPYHPQDNGQVESTNKVLEDILTKTFQLHHQDWADRLPEALWAYQTTWRNTTGHTPYEIVYGKQVILPIEFQVRTFRIAA